MNLFMIKTWLQVFFSKNEDGERGASLVEYALLVALIAVVCIGAVVFIGSSSSEKLDSAGSAID